MEPTDTPSSPAAQDPSPASTLRPAGEFRREEASDPPTEERGEDWESPAFRRKATPADAPASADAAPSAPPAANEGKPARARRGRPPATKPAEAVTSPAPETPPAPALPPELLKMGELHALLLRLPQDERTRALVWAVQKFNVDLHVLGIEAEPAARKVVAKAVTTPAPRAAKVPVVARPAAPKPAARVAPAKPAKAVAAKRGRPAGAKAKVKAAAPTGKVVDAKALSQFIARHKPQTDVERLVVLAGFLAQEGQQLFETRDVTGANKATGAKDFTNASATVAVSIKRSLLTRVGEKLRLTPSGHTLLTELSGAKSAKRSK